MTTGILALIILIAILVQVTIAAMIGINRRWRHSRDLDGLGGLTRALVPDPEPDKLTDGPLPATEAWTGFREFSVERREFEDEGQSTCSFYLVPCNGDRKSVV